MDSIGVLGAFILFSLMTFCTLLVLILMSYSYQAQKDCALINSAQCVWQMMPVVKGETE